jgi:hypothetical protein
MMTKAELMKALKAFSIQSVKDAPGLLEPMERATYYVARRIEQGQVRDTQEMKSVWAAFADGFSTAKERSV